MNCITLDNILPDAFAADKTSPGDVWGRRVSFVRGEKVRIEASSGSGKTTLCAFIMGMRDDFAGQILFDGTSSSGFTQKQWSAMRRDRLAWLPQDMGLFPQLTLRENICLKNALTGFRDDAWIVDACAWLGIEDCLDRNVGRMSIGQQQRGALVRTLCQPFDFLLLDEPVSHLDPRCNKAVAALVDRELRATGAGLIVTSVGQHLDIGIDKRLSL